MCMLWIFSELGHSKSLVVPHCLSCCLLLPQSQKGQVLKVLGLNPGTSSNGRNSPGFLDLHCPSNTPFLFATAAPLNPTLVEPSGEQWRHLLVRWGASPEQSLESILALGSLGTRDPFCKSNPFQKEKKGFSLGGGARLAVFRDHFQLGTADFMGCMD